MTTISLLPETTEVGAVTLLARDLPRLAQFYATLLGLQTTEQSSERVTLAAHGRPLLHLLAARLPAPAANRPGLYHTAFLLPTRAALGQWVAHASHLGLPIGSGDHLVSEAFYLSDPEGNGIEIYADRPRDTWEWQNGEVRMDTLSVDVPAVLQAAGLSAADLHSPTPPPYAGVPAETRVGHVHLKVGNAAEAARFYADALGLDIVSRLPGAAFLSWGGYHHHLGLNEWHSRGQGHPAAPAAGLGEVEFVTPDLSRLRGRPGFTEEGGALHLTDPWGNRVRVRQVGA